MGLSDNERQLGVFGRVEKLAYKIIITDFTVFTAKYYGSNLFIFNCEPW